MPILTGSDPLARSIVHYARLCYERGLVGAAGGNLSARLPGAPPGQDLFMVSASGVSLRDLAVETLVVVDGTGKMVEGRPGLRPSKETGFHLSLFRARPGVGAVVHVHPPYAVLFSALGQAIPLVTVSAKLKLKQGPVVPEADPGSQALNDGVRHAVEESGRDTSVLLLQNHGLVSFAENLGDAFDYAELASDTAKIAWLLRTDPAGSGAAAGTGAVAGSGAAAGAAAALRVGSIVELSIPLDHALPCYPTDPRYERTVHVDFADAGSYVSRITMGLHAGTHVDAPLHFLQDGTDIMTMAPEKFFGPALAIDAPKGPGQDIEPSDFARADIRRGDIVLFRTGWQDRNGTAGFFQGEWPGFSVEAVRDLVALGVKAIGGDIPSADSPSHIAAGAPAHKAALGAGLPIFEALVNLDKVTGTRFSFLGLPLRIAGGEASPIRAIAIREP